MHRANAYAAVTEELRRWSQMPVADLLTRVNRPPEVREVTVQREVLMIEVAASWADAKHTSIRIEATANGPSHWRMERLIERVVVPVPERIP
jgi:hypothetical protein